MVGNPDFLTQTGQDQDPELQELETPEGELFLRFFVTSEDEFRPACHGNSPHYRTIPRAHYPHPQCLPPLAGHPERAGPGDFGWPTWGSFWAITNR